MKDFLVKNFSILLIAGLVLLLYFKGAFSGNAQPILIQTDTSWHRLIQGPQAAPSTLVQTIPYPVTQLVREPQYIADTSSISALKKQFEQLRDEFLTLKVYQQDLKIDSIGYVHTRDSIQKNGLVGSSYSFDLKYPTVTITRTLPPKRQLFIGGGLSSPATGTPGLQQVDLGLLYKDRREQVLGASVGYNFPLHTPVVRLSYQIKLHFGK